MKKLLKIALVALLALGLIGCQGGGKKDPEPQKPEEKVVKVALLVPFLGDQSYYDTMERGRKAVDAKYGDKVYTRTYEVGDTTDEATWMSAFQEVCEDGEYDLVIGCNGNYEEYLYASAKKYPNQLFLNVDTSNPQNLPNTYSTYYATSDLGYVVAALSAAITKTGTVGVVVGKDNQGMNQFISGYVQCLAANNVKYVISYPDTFSDATKGYEVTNQMIDKGADVIWGVAGGTGNGVIQACAEAREAGKDVWAIGVDQDQYAQFLESYPSWAKAILTSALKNSDVIIETCVDWLFEGTLGNKMNSTEKWGIALNGVGLAENDYYKANCPEAVRNQVAATLKDVADGKVAVYDALEDKNYNDNWPAIRDANILN